MVGWAMGGGHHINSDIFFVCGMPAQASLLGDGVVFRTIYVSIIQYYLDKLMGFAGISPGSLLLIFLIVLVFGPKRLESLGEELGKALRGFRKGLDGDQPSQPKDVDQSTPL